MFDKILEVWKRESLLHQSQETIEQMLELTQKMFLDACRGLSENKAFSDVDVMDDKVNKMLVEVRKKVLEHLTVSPGKNLSESMILILVAIDLERIGDHCKNIAEINEHYKKELKKAKQFKELETFKEKIIENFGLAREGFLHCDLKKAKKVNDSHKIIKNRLVRDFSVSDGFGTLVFLGARQMAYGSGGEWTYWVHRPGMPEAVDLRVPERLTAEVERQIRLEQGR